MTLLISAPRRLCRRLPRGSSRPAEPDRHQSTRAWPRAGRAFGVIGLLAVLLGSGGCTLLRPPPEPAPAPPPVPQPVAAAAPLVCPPEAPPAEADAGELPALLAYHQELRAMSATDIARELAALNAQPRTPAQAVRKAMALVQSRGGSELLQAQVQLDSVAAFGTPQAEQLRPLVSLLATRLAEQRRLGDNLERLNQQLRESQRRNEQLNEKLEALKAIEQRLPASPASPASPGPGASAAGALRQP